MTKHIESRYNKGVTEKVEILWTVFWVNILSHLERHFKERSKNMRKNQTNFAKVLTLGALVCASRNATAEENENGRLSINMPMNVNIEKTKGSATYGEITLKPGIEYKGGDWAVEARYWASRFGYSDGVKSAWMDPKLYAQILNDEFRFRVGKMGIYDESVASFILVPMSCNLDDSRIAVAGDNAVFTGAHALHRKSGIGIGWVSSSGERITMKHWDAALLSWEHKYGPVGINAHAAVNHEGLYRSGVSVAYQPTDKTVMSAELLRYNNIEHALFGIRQQVHEKLAVFAGGAVSKDKHWSGWGAAGAEYDIGHGMKWVVVGKHGIGPNAASYSLETALKCELGVHIKK